MRRRGADAPEIAAALKAMNRRRCERPGTDAEMDKIAESMMRYTPGEPSQNGTSPATSVGAVNTAELLDEVKAFIARFVVLPSPAAGDLLWRCCTGG